jgi:4-amino-4-deoxy-L-arabinose transferase-like glycosyltransferase
MTGWRRPLDLLDTSGLIEQFKKMESWGPSIFVLIAIVWFLLVVPAISIRGFHYEEDTVVALAKGAAQDGHWLAPDYYGLRFVERPVLMSWLIGALAWLTGEMNQWVVRGPTVLSLLLGGILVARLVHMHASALAALFGALCFFLCPSILQRLVNAEPDVMCSVLQFLAFVIWWSDYRKGGSSIPKWLMIGAILTCAGLLKGPQPLAYFFSGVGAFLILKRSWLQLLGLTLAGAVAGGTLASWYVAVYQPGDIGHWMGHSRIGVTRTFAQYVTETASFAVQLTLELMPSFLVVTAFYAMMQKEGRFRADDDPNTQLAIALLLYAIVCTIVLAFWPGGSNTRYAIPAVPAVAAAAGLAFDRLRSSMPRLINLSLAALACLATYQIVVGWILMPNFQWLFAKSRITGSTVASAIAANPATLYAVGGAANSSLIAYIPTKVRLVALNQLATAPLPAWAVLNAEQLDRLRLSDPKLHGSVRLVMRDFDNALLVFLHANGDSDAAGE